jgi:uncharacterized glyoxalase superfamily protein PhnB
MASPVLTPYIAVKGGAEAIDFYVRAFGAEELFRLVDPADGRIGHAELKLGESVLMIADEYPDFGALSPASLGGSTVKLHLRVEDADATVARALALGALSLRPLQDEFYGERTGLIEDPFGYAWFIASSIEDVSPEEMQRRWNASTSV